MNDIKEERKGIQMMKKRFAAMMTVAVLSGAMAVTSLAEGPAADTGMQMSENSQAPQTGENGEAPQTGENSQIPQMGENGRMQQPGGMGRGGNMGRDGRRENFGFIRFEDKVTDGTISQETYEAITKYMEENKPELPTETEDGEREDRKAGEGPDLLTDLLEAGVITQEEYESLSAARESAKPDQQGEAGTRPAAPGEKPQQDSSAADASSSAAVNDAQTGAQSSAQTGETAAS